MTDDHTWIDREFAVLIQGNKFLHAKCSACKLSKLTPGNDDPRRWTLERVDPWDGKTSCAEVLEKQRATVEKQRQRLELQQPAVATGSQSERIKAAIQAAEDRVKR